MREIHNGSFYLIVVKIKNNCELYVDKKGGLTGDKYKARAWKLLSGAEKNLDKFAAVYKGAFISER